MKEKEPTLNDVISIIDDLTSATIARFSRMGSKFESIDQKFESIDQRFDQMDKKIEKRKLVRFVLKKKNRWVGIKN